MSDDAETGADEDKEFGSNYDELIDRLVDRQWDKCQSDDCCADCGRLVDGSGLSRWTGEDANGEGIYESLCGDCGL